MQTSLRALSALAIIGTVGFIVAQQIATKSDEGFSSQPGDRPVANGQLYGGKASANRAPHSYAAPSGAQRVFERYIPAETNRLIEMAEAQGKSQRISKIIEVQCYYMLTVMRPDEQKHEMYDVWAVDIWKPNGEWNHITNAPTLVKFLADMPADQGKRVHAAFAKSEDEWMKPFMDLNHRIADEVGHDMERYRNRYNEELLKINGGKSKVDICNAYVAKLNEGMSAAYALLTTPQKREWDLILSNFKRDALAAYNGDAPELGVSNH